MRREEKGVPIAESSLLRMLMPPNFNIKMLCAQLTNVNGLVGEFQ
jgi:hypothetical protein